MILSWMLYASAVALLLALAALAVESALRRRGLPLRGAWAAALLASLLLPVAAALGVSIPGDRSPAPRPAAPAELVQAYPIQEVAASALPRAADADPWLLALWGVASAGIAIWFVVASLDLRRRRSRWVPRRVDGRHILVSPDTGPAVFGVLHSRVVVPEWVLDRAAGDRAMILAHEEEHILARDPPLLATALLLVAVFPWNLPIWWQWRRLRDAVEVDCDRRVLARGADPRAYGRLLVDVNRYGTAQRLAVAALAEPPSILERRIRAMITSYPRWRLYTAGSVAIAAVALAGACNLDRPTPISGPSKATTQEARELPAIAYEVAVLDEKPVLNNPGEVAELIDRAYPPALNRAETGGRATVQFVIESDGTVRGSSVKAVSATHEELLAAVTEVAAQLTFRPGRYQGQAVPVLIQMPITWGVGGPVPPRAVGAAPAPSAPRPTRDGAPQGSLFAYEVAVLDEKPELLNKAEVARTMQRLYPETLRGATGQAMVQFVITAEGTVEPRSVKVIQSTHPELEAASAKVAETFKFRPGRYRGDAVRVLIQMPITWQPQG